jgi:hypothetical protein
LRSLYSRRTEAWIVALLLALFAVAGVNSLVRDSVTFDETAHLPAGFSYLDRHDFRMNPEHPPLSKAWAALPLWLGGIAAPDYSRPAWTGGSEWVFGFEFLNGPRDSLQRDDPQRLIVPGRLAMLVLGLLLGMIVFFWSRALWGQAGALLALFLYCLSPTMLAHTRLVTTDLPTGLGFSATLWAFWLLCRQPGWWRVLLFALALTGALLMKFSSLLLLPILSILALLWLCWRDDGLERRHKLRWLAIAATATIAVSYLGIWAGYGFRFSAAADSLYSLDWNVVGLKEGPLYELVQSGLRHRLLPEAYLYGLAYFLGGAARRLSYLNGEQSILGWWYYFPQAFLMKTPPAAMALWCWLLGLVCWKRRLRSFTALFLVIPIAIYLGVSMLSNLNIGHRHLVPIYPLLFILAGALPGLLVNRRRVILGVLLTGYALSFAQATPSYLSYFNLFAGGSTGGANHLLDSNLDWGQDLIRLKQWMDREQVPQIHLAYFGTADPRAYGIDYRKVHLVHDFEPRTPASRPAGGDHVAISVNLLKGLYFDEDRALAEALGSRGWLDQPTVSRWLALRDTLSSQGRRHPSLADWLIEQRLIDSARLAQAGSGLLSTWLKQIDETLEPVGRAGDSISIYRMP